MTDRARRGLTGVMSMVTIAGLMLGGGLYVWTLRNAEQLSDRNLRELARIGRDIEGQVDNLHRVMRNLSQADSLSAVNRVRIPYLSDSQTDAVSAGTDTITTLKLSELGYLELSYNGLAKFSPDTGVVLAKRWSLEALEPTLGSEYFDLTLLADPEGTVFLSAPDFTSTRVQSLPVLLDSLLTDRTEEDSESAVPAVTTIRTASIAGREYRVFIQPLTIPLNKSSGVQQEVAVAERWLLAGLVPENSFQQESLALGPSAVLALGLALVLAFLSWPFIRSATMGPRERLRVRHLLYLVVSSVLLSGGVGLALADFTYFGSLRSVVYAQVGALADRLHAEVEGEVQAALRQIASLTVELDPLDERAPVPPPMRTRLDARSLSDYPALTMVFWTDSAGMQRAKWTPRSSNTARVDVANRDYYQTISDGAGWNPPAGWDDSYPEYYIESLRTYTTGEKSAAISTANADVRSPFLKDGVGVALTKFLSLDQPLLPSGVSFAVVDSSGRALFHARKERAGEENLIDETGGDERVRSTLRAHAGRAHDVVYRGRRTHLFIRPFEGTPNSLVVFLDKAQLETVHFEAIFLGATLFAALALAMMFCFALVEALVPRKMHWVWPDPDGAGKYLALCVILLLLIAELVIEVVSPGFFTSDLGPLVVPFQALGLGLIALSLGHAGSVTMRRARWFGAFLAIAATAGLAWQTISGPIDGAGVLSLSVQLIVAALAAGAVALEYAVDQGRSSRVKVPDGARAVWSELRIRLGRGVGTTRLYVASMVLGLVLIGGLPGFILYQRAFNEHVDLLVRYHQVELVQSLKARAANRNSLMRDAGLAPEFRGELDALTYDLQEAPRPFGLCWEDSTGASSSPTDCLAATRITIPERQELAEPLHDRVPFLSQISVAMRQLGEDQPDREWWLASDATSPQLVEGPYTVGSQVPHDLGAPLWWWVLAVPTSVGLLLGVVVWLSRRVFLVDLWAAPPLTLDAVVDSGPEMGHLVVVCTRSTDRSPLDRVADRWDIIDMIDRDVDSGDTPRLEVDDEMEVLCLDHADHRIGEPEWGSALLGFLENVVYVDRRPARVVILTSREPIDLLAPENRNPEDDDLAHRWTRLLGQFTRVAVQDRAEEVPFGERARDLVAEMRASGVDPERIRAVERVLPVIAQECNRPSLEKIGLNIVKTYPSGGMSMAEMIGRIRDEADTYYDALWSVLGDRERLVIAQLASGAAVNPSCGAAVTRLLGRGIVIRGPELRIMNESFTQFVRDKAPESVILEWERAGSASTWELIRLPFVFGWIAIALFLFWTQRDLLGNTIAFLSTAGVGLAAIVRLLTLFYAGPAGGGKEGLSKPA